MIWEVPGITVGHHTDQVARTGCTVVLADPAVLASGEVRGGAPATREFALLDPMAKAQQVDAVVLTGGSAFGLAAADGVVGWLEDRGRGFPTAAGPVPIVVAVSLFDLAVGDPSVRPTAADGRAAAERAAAGGSSELGSVGAGCGATVGKWRGAEHAVPGALVGAVARHDDVVVGALVAVNSWGDVAGVGRSHEPDPVIGHGGFGPPQPPPSAGASGGAVGVNTTIGVVATNAAVDKVGCLHLCRGAHDGLARAVSPPHATVDGDAFVALSTGRVAAHPDLVRWMAVTVVADAIASLAVHPDAGIDAPPG